MHSYTSSYKQRPSSLSTLAKKLGTDKGSPIDDEPFNSKWYYHKYTDFYEFFFGPWRQHVVSMFECGIGTTNQNIESNMGIKGTHGASLYMWRTLFPNAHIYGADIDENILFEDERISTFKVDQLDAASVESLSKSLPSTLDIIVDDGLHKAEAAISLFKGLFNNLRPGGVYVIEDVWKGMVVDSMRDKLVTWADGEGLPYELISFSNSKHDVNLMVFRKPFEL